MKDSNYPLQQKIRNWMLFFIVSLVASGITALGVETWLEKGAGLFPYVGNVAGQWLQKVYLALQDVNSKYPFMSYGYDWLAFSHLVIAVAFIGVLKDPVRNKWVVQFGRIACAMVIPFALIMGNFRGLPFWWILVDCSFGIIGFIPLTLCSQLINKLEIQKLAIQS